MTVQTDTMKRQHRTAASPEPVSERRRGAGRTIVASAVAGAVAALVLVLVIFPGATEATTTGLVLLAFGFGWALMAFLTVRRTRQPQRWAYVPAAAMSATGAALVVLHPGNQTMTALNWVWPPLMAALAAWIFVQVRRSVTGKSRWVLFPVISVLVLSNGLGGLSAGWARITAPIAATTRVCAYDRAGQGWSDEAESPRDGIQSAEDLHTLLATAGEDGPYVLVGHSTGGTHAMTYAARYPEQVAGMVLLDSSSPEQFTRMPAFPGQYAMMRRLYGPLSALSRLGLGQLVPGTSHLPGADAATVNAMTSTPQAYRNQRAEVSVLAEVFT